MRNLHPLHLVLAVALVLISSRSLAQTAPSTAQAVKHLQATITAVEGIVQVRADDSHAWEMARIGMVLSEDAELRTGIRSAVRFVIPPDHTITVDRLGSVKLLQAIVDKGIMKTEIGMPYGRTEYDVQAGGQAHEATIVSPSATMAVRGTTFIDYDQRPFPATGTVLTGRMEFRDFKKRVTLSAQGGKTAINTDVSNAPTAALDQAVVDPGARLARTDAEETLVNTLLSSGATLSFDFQKGIRVIRGGQVPRTDAELIPTLPGNLNFVLRWQGNTDLNLAVGAQNAISPQTETLYPIAGLDSTPSGGRILFDHRGGPNGGIEIGFWPGNVPTGTYEFGSVLISGPPTAATIDVFRNGQRIPFIGPDGNTTTTASYTAETVPPSIASGQAVGILRISPGSSSETAAPATGTRKR